MCDEDSFYVATVPRYGRFGAAADEDANSTLGDRFFDMLELQTNTVKKSESKNYMVTRDGQHLLSPDRGPEQISFGTTATVTAGAPVAAAAAAVAEASEGNIQDVPFGINKLAMFRSSSRTRLSGRRSNAVPQEENAVQISTTCTVKLNNGNLRQNGIADKKTMRSSSGTVTGSQNAAGKTIRNSIPRPLYPAQEHQRPLSRESGRPPSLERRPRMGPVTRQQAVRVRAASGDTGMRRSALGTIRTNGTLAREATATNNGVRVPPRGPLRVRSASTDSAGAARTSTARAATAASSARSTAQRQQGVTSAGNVLGSAAATAAVRKSSYVGPETRARARMKQRSQSRDLPDVVNTNPISSTPKRAKPVRVRPLSQLNPNIPPPPRNVANNAAAPASEDKPAESGHISRPRTRIAHGPVRVQNTQATVKGEDGLPPVGTENRFRQSVTRRPKGGDSLERDVTQEAGKENGGDEIWTVSAKKAPQKVLEFAPCLRSRVAAKKTQGTAGVAGPSKRSAVAVPSGPPRASGGGDMPVRRRRTEAERDAFFRRLSTPKTVTVVKKGAK